MSSASHVAVELPSASRLYSCAWLPPSTNALHTTSTPTKQCQRKKHADLCVVRNPPILSYTPVIEHGSKPFLSVLKAFESTGTLRPCILFALS